MHDGSRFRQIGWTMQVAACEEGPVKAGQTPMAALRARLFVQQHAVELSWPGTPESRFSHLMTHA